MKYGPIGAVRLNEQGERQITPIGNEGEPLFVLRGQDKLAAAAVRYYAMLRYTTGDAVGSREIMRVADEMEAWHPRKMPD